jgi:single-strand DNA-binding protein
LASFNRVILMGNLTRDPQLKFLPSGTPVCEFGLATNRRFTDQSGQQREIVMFVDCQAMGKLGEIISKNFTKGKPILVEGRLDYRQWQTQTGEKRSKHEVFVETFSFVGTAGGGQGGPSEGDRPSRGRQQQGRPQGEEDGMAGDGPAETFEDVPF